VLVLFLALTLFSILLLIVGFTWMMTTSGRTRHESGEKVGAQITGEQLSDDDSSIARKTTFKGWASSFERESSISFTDIKKRFSAGRYSEALPSILIVTGLLGLLMFGSLALFTAMENKMVGGMIALVTIFTVLRIVVRMVRA
jgi:hypothetical protein